MSNLENTWKWETDTDKQYVRILPGGELEWGGYEKLPRHDGGSVRQLASEFLDSGKPGYRWMEPPTFVLEEVRAALLALQRG